MNLKGYILILCSALVLLSSCQSTSNEPAIQFWEWFKTNQSKFYNEKKISEQSFNDILYHLKKIDTDLTCNISLVHANGIRELTISADGIRMAFPKVKYVIGLAPKIDKWQFNAFRQRISVDSLSIQYDDIELSYQDIYFTYTQDSGKVSIELNIRNYKDAASYNGAAYVLLDAVIGEYDMETQITSVDFAPLDENKISTLYPITKLRDIVDNNKKRTQQPTTH